MSEALQSITTAVVSLALDAASLRHRAIAANIANASTEGYVPVRVSFESQLAEATRMSSGRSPDTAALTQAAPRIEPALDAAGRPERVQLDSEIARLSQNGVHFQALARGLSKHMAIMAMAVGDGKK